MVGNFPKMYREDASGKISKVTAIYVKTLGGLELVKDGYTKTNSGAKRFYESNYEAFYLKLKVEFPNPDNILLQFRNEREDSMFVSDNYVDFSVDKGDGVLLNIFT